MHAKAQEKLSQPVFVRADLLRGWPTKLEHRFNRIVSAYVLHEFDQTTKVKLLVGLTECYLAAERRIVMGDIAFPTSEVQGEPRRKWAELWDDKEYYWVADEAAEICVRGGLQVMY